MSELLVPNKRYFDIFYLNKIDLLAIVYSALACGNALQFLFHIGKKYPLVTLCILHCGTQWTISGTPEFVMFKFVKRKIKNTITFSHRQDCVPFNWIQVRIAMSRKVRLKITITGWKILFLILKKETFRSCLSQMWTLDLCTHSW